MLERKDVSLQHLLRYPQHKPIVRFSSTVDGKGNWVLNSSVATTLHIKKKQTKQQHHSLEDPLKSLVTAKCTVNEHRRCDSHKMLTDKIGLPVPSSPPFY